MATTSTVKQEIDLMKTDVAILHNEMANISKYFDKLDNTVEKMQELLASMHRMITLHEERISVQVDNDKDLRRLFEERKTETNKSLESLAEKIEEANKKLWKLDLKRGTMVGAIIMLAFIIGPILSGFFQAYYTSHIH